MPTTVQLEPVLSDIDVRKTIQDHYHHVVPSHIGDYTVSVLQWHPDAFVELGINTYHLLFDCYFLFWLKILYAFDSQPHLGEGLLKMISVVNAEVADESVAVSAQSWGFSQTYILGITFGSSMDITDLKDMENLAWFPDSK
ncbi:hypothetical protein ARMGADRAFT_1083486 [Armillaria gallica]|uniref:Uncharacterized protein n=1 Tax=Armillaria gallica TaxID=47427 RepID=A0A2H3DDJ2_ARMGA|nr:hypothetical protein ARMGADRAFT_1083486 [Armillaria gallica]